MRAVAIIDYGMGNIGSIGRALDSAGVPWMHTRDPVEVAAASHVVLPGVGHAGEAMRVLEGSDCLDALRDAALRRQVPVLGICLGMQLMTAWTEEGARDCLGWFPHRTEELRPASTRLKVPNIGWHRVRGDAHDRIFAGISLHREPFYFCHRYGVVVGANAEVVASFEYGNRLAATLRAGNLIGVQFHPEKSQEAGLRLIRNFLDMGGPDA